MTPQGCRVTIQRNCCCLLPVYVRITWEEVQEWWVVFHVKIHFLSLIISGVDTVQFSHCMRSCVQAFSVICLFVFFHSSTASFSRLVQFISGVTRPPRPGLKLGRLESRPLWGMSQTVTCVEFHLRKFRNSTSGNSRVEEEEEGGSPRETQERTIEKRELG